MTAPSRRSETHTTSNTTTTLSNLTCETGDLIVIWAAGGDSAPQVQLDSVSAHSSNVSFEDPGSSGVSGSRTVITAADGSGTTFNADKRKDDSAGSGGYLHIWSALCTGSVTSKQFDASISNWTTGARRWGIIVLNPGSGNSWPVRASRVQRTSTTTDTAAAAVDPWSVAWTGSHYNAESAAVLAVYHGSAKTISVDWDNSGDYTSSNSAGDTGDGGSTVFLGGTGSGTNQAACAGDAYWDTGGIPGGADSQIGIDGSTSTGAKAGAAVLYKISAPTTITGTATFAGGGTFAATGTRTTSGTASFDGGGTFTATGTPTVNGTLHFDGGGTFQLTQQGITVVDGTASFAGGGTFAATGTPTVLGTAEFFGGGTFTLTGAGQAQAYASGNNWSASSAELIGGETKTGTCSFDGGGTFTAVGRPIVQFAGIAHFSGGGTFTAVGTPTVTATMSFSGGGTFSLSSGRDCQWTFALRQPKWKTKPHEKWDTTLARP